MRYFLCRQAGENPEHQDFWTWESGCLHGLVLDVFATGPRKIAGSGQTSRKIQFQGNKKTSSLDFCTSRLDAPPPVALRLEIED
jgi:hypothetical protein